MKPASTARDFLTNCYSREGILPFLRNMEEIYVGSKTPFSILMMDVDHFKSFNDSFGHLMGDEVLKYFSSSMRLDLEDEQNVPFRFGGDEFVMVFPNITPVEAYRLGSRLRKNIRTRSCLVKGKQNQVTFSGGIAGYPTDATSVEDILEKADKALYYSKNHGRGRITKYSDLGSKEFLRAILTFLILAAVGYGLYFFRDTLAGIFGKAETKVAGLIQKFTPAPAPDKPPPVPQTAASPAGANQVRPAAPPSGDAEISAVYLESGRVIRGIIRRQDDESLTVEVRLAEGKGVLQIKRSQVLRIESGSKSAAR